MTNPLIGRPIEYAMYARRKEPYQGIITGVEQDEVGLRVSIARGEEVDVIHPTVLTHDWKERPMTEKELLKSL